MLERWRRRRRAREISRRLEELDRLDNVIGLGAWPSEAPPRRSRRTALWAAVAAVLFFGTAVAVDQWETRQDRGHYAFFNVDPVTGDPVRWPSCSPIRYQVNPDGAPDGWQDLVSTGIEHVSEATGLQFEDVGITMDRNHDSRQMGDPVLIMWADEDEVPKLGGRVAGFAGPSWMTTADGRMSPYRTGKVVLDSESFAEMNGEGKQAVFDHELAHLVGLDHVDEEDQLMSAGDSSVRTFQAGDLAGLERLGDGPCT